MEKLVIENTKSSPEVVFDPEQHRLAIRGQSYPENAIKFYEPVLLWLDRYLEEVADQQPVVLELLLPYMNTSSTKCFMLLLDKLEDAHQSGKQLEVMWYYNTDNESELECAEEFKEDYSLPFHITPRKE
jgi:hypothetical protein